MKRGIRLSVDSKQLLLFFFLAGICLGTLVGNLGAGRVPAYGTRQDGTGQNGTGRDGTGQDGTVQAGRAGTGQIFQAFENRIAQDRPWRRQEGGRDKFWYICRQRLCEGAIGWLLGLTVCAVPCFWGLAGYMGFSVGWVIVCYTAGWGLLGLPRFFLSCFPQWLCYLPAWYLFIWLGFRQPVRVRPFPALLAFGLLCLGAGAEAFANPFFLNLL